MFWDDLERGMNALGCNKKAELFNKGTLEILDRSVGNLGFLISKASGCGQIGILINRLGV